MRKILILSAVVLFIIISSPLSAMACEFCTMHNGLGQYNNQGDFVSVTYRSTTASDFVTGSTVQPWNNYQLTINTTQLYYQHSFGENLKGSLVIPMISKSLNNAGVQDSSSGLGDVMALARYNIFNNDDSFIAVQGGVKLATGAKAATKATPTVFSPDLVLGTGSTDILAGIIYNRNMGEWNFSVDALYKFSGTGYDGYQFGNVLNWGLNGYYRLNENINAGLGLVSEVMSADNDTTGTVSGATGTVANTGGSVIFAQPTIQYVNNNIYADISYQTPISRSFTGSQNVVNNKFILNLRYAF